MAAMDNRGEPYKHGCTLSLFLEQLGTRIFCYRFIADGSIGFKITMCTSTARMHHAFRYTLAIEVRNFFKELVILERSWAAVAHRTQVLIIGYRVALAR